MNSLFENLYNAYKHIYYSNSSNSSMYLNKFGDICKFYAYINANELENALYRIIDCEKNNEKYDSAVIECLHSMLFHNVNINQTIKYTEKIIVDNKITNPSIAKACQFYLDAYNKGHTYLNIFPNECVFSIQNVKDYISFSKIVKANAVNFQTIPPLIQPLFCEAHFCEIIQESDLKDYINSSTKKEKDIFLKRSMFPSELKKVLWNKIQKNENLNFNDFIKLCYKCENFKYDDYLYLLDRRIFELLQSITLCE